MVKKIKIIATSPTGEDELKKQFKLLSKAENFIFRKVFKRELSEDPVVLSLELRSSAVAGIIKAEDLTRRIEEELLKTGCIRSVDYETEVEE